MNRYLMLTMLAISSAMFGGTTHAQDAPQLALAKVYISGLSNLEATRQDGENEDTQDKARNPNDPQSRFMDCVHGMTALQLTLDNFSLNVKSVHLAPEDQKTQEVIVTYNEMLKKMYKDFGDTCENILYGPYSNSNYNELGARLPKIRAYIEETERSYIQMAPIVFGLLIEPRNDSQGHANHLLITRGERDSLIGDIETDFESKLRSPHPNSFVSAAAVFEDYLQKGFKGSDEPWN